jgi:hypothetical protein
MSQTCHEETHAPQQLPPLFNHLGAGEQRGCIEAERLRLKSFSGRGRSHLGGGATTNSGVSLTLARARRH